MASWSAAAARNVSPAASRTERPAADCRRASLPMVVVLPTPLTPTMSQTSGAPGVPSKRKVRLPVVSSSSRMAVPRAASRSSPPPISLASTRARRSASSASVVATPTSARMSASSSDSQVDASIRPERSADTAPLNSPRTVPRRLR